ncbi:MAG: efflux RND transporter periplasmic adaptor subunit [Planctomycetes bacterium]|nr:efflux RND transporter periplasmic adaptor subunit [Planctomycetota bacterium]
MSQVSAKQSQFNMSGRWWWAAAAILLTGTLIFSRSHWLPYLRGVGATPKAGSPATGEHAGHDHAAHAEISSIKLSPQAQANIGLKVAQVELRSFEPTISIPGIIVERPGRSTVQITAPVTGVIMRIYPILGEAVRPGQKLFDIRITHEELVQAQADFLRTAEELDVIGKEIERLERVALEGVVAGKTLLERQYERQKQLAVQRAQHQALLLHGLSEQQVQAILSTRTLLPNMTVFVPTEEQTPAAEVVYQVQELKIAKGQHVTAGDTMAILADHGQLLIQGNAFEKDAAALAKAVKAGSQVSAIVDADGNNPEVVGDLAILYLSGKVDTESRAFHFYVTLPNELLKKLEPKDGHEFIYWKFKPGQRVQIKVPVEQWKDRIVLPVDALAQDGAETYVFQQNGDKFERRPVHVEYRDQSSVVIANDGSIFPGDKIAMSCANQLLFEIKNKAGGAPDPHAGHNH